MMNIQELTAPFLLSWTAVWLFSFLGGIASAFIRIADIDKRLLYPFIAKPLIGMATGLALCLLINGENDPPSISLAFWGFIGSLCSAPIVTGFLIFISDQERQNELYKSAQDRFLPFKVKGNDDKNSQHSTGGSDDSH